MPSTPDRSAAQRQRATLEAAFDGVEDARMIVGQFIPVAVREWAEERGLEARETQFAPPGRIFIVGAVPIPEFNGIARG